MLKTRINYIIFGSAVLCLFNASLVLADTYSLPQPLVSEGVTIKDHVGFFDQTDNYGGFTGNEAVYNFDPNTPSNTAESLGFLHNNLNGLDDTCYKNIKNLVQCFVSPLGSVPPYSIMNSRTQVNGRDATEVAALVYNLNNVNGDVYSASGAMRSFTSWGNSLSINSSTINPRWSLSGYALNPESQGIYDPANPASKTYYDGRITSLKGEAKELTSSGYSAGSWFLQSDDNGTSTFGTGANDPGRFPEGRVWTISNTSPLVINQPIKYYGKGTIILNGPLELAANASITQGDLNSSLGIIILNGSSGNQSLILNKGTTLTAAVFAQGTLDIDSSGKNINALGSFIALAFNIPTNASNVSFRYDRKLSNNWPPGFRYFNMPIASEK